MQGCRELKIPHENRIICELQRPTMTLNAGLGEQDSEQAHPDTLTYAQVQISSYGSFALNL